MSSSLLSATCLLLLLGAAQAEANEKKDEGLDSLADMGGQFRFGKRFFRPMGRFQDKFQKRGVRAFAKRSNSYGLGKDSYADDLNNILSYGKRDLDNTGIPSFRVAEKRSDAGSSYALYRFGKRSGSKWGEDSSAEEGKASALRQYRLGKRVSAAHPQHFRFGKRGSAASDPLVAYRFGKRGGDVDPMLAYRLGKRGSEDLIKYRFGKRSNNDLIQYRFG